MKKIRRITSVEGVGVAIILVILFAFLAIMSPFFLTSENLSNLMVQSVFVMVVSFGMMFVLTMGGIDLSVGSILGLCGGVTGLVMMNGSNMWVAILAGLALGIVLGLVNGLFITKLRIPPFLATFAMLNIARGLLMLATIDEPIRQFATPEFAFIAQGTVGGIPMPFLITIIIFAICYFVFHFTSFGRYVVAVGSNTEAAHLSGVSVNSIKLRVYALSGLLAAGSGILLASRLTAVQPLAGTSYELDAIAAAVIGGTSMSGGKGSLIGTAIGAVILALVSNGLDLLSVNQFYRMIITGAIIILAVGAKRFSSSSADAA